jgi:RNA polymerase sigma-70 factor (ECF subfamily)
LADTPAEPDWELFVGLYRPFILGWLGSSGVPEQDAADLSQDVFTCLLKELAGFRHAERTGAFRSWLKTLIVNRARNYWRGRKSPPDGAEILDQLADPDSGLSGEWDRQHDAHVARQLLAAIEGEFAPLSWSAFRRHVLEERRAADVAAELGTTVNVVLLAKSRVLRRLREEAAGLLDSFDRNLTRRAL